jgi:hypothetical protein
MSIKIIHQEFEVSFLAVFTKDYNNHPDVLFHLPNYSMGLILNINKAKNLS